MHHSITLYKRLCSDKSILAQLGFPIMCSPEMNILLSTLPSSLYLSTVFTYLFFTLVVFKQILLLHYCTSYNKCLYFLLCYICAWHCVTLPHWCQHLKRLYNHLLTILSNCIPFLREMLNCVEGFEIRTRECCRQ